MLRIILTSLLLSVLANGVSLAGSSIKISMEEMRIKSPETAAKEALDRGDRRLLGVRAYSLHVPGAEMEIFEAERLFGVVTIEGTTDYYKTPAIRDFNEAARNYAAKYNRYIVQHASSPARP